MTKDEKEFLKAAIKAGAVYTTPIRTLGPLGHQAVKETNERRPYGH